MNEQDMQKMVEKVNEKRGVAVIIPFPLPDGEEFDETKMLMIYGLGIELAKQTKLTVAIGAYDWFIDPENNEQGISMFVPIATTNGRNVNER